MERESRSNNKAFDLDGKLIREFQPTNADMNANFIDVMRSRKVEALEGDILQGHLSAALMHAANISYRLGRSASPGEIRERIGGQQELLNAYHRFHEHLEANGVDPGQTPAVLGPMLTLDPDAERFTGAFSTEANKLVARAYRAPFVVPEKV